MSNDSNQLARQIGEYGSDLQVGAGTIDTDTVPSGWTCILAEDGDAVVKAICKDGSHYTNDGASDGSAKTLLQNVPFFGWITSFTVTSGNVRAYRRAKEE